MSPVILAAVSFGIQFSSELISFIADELTEQDRQKYQKICSEINALRSYKEQKLREISNKNEITKAELQRITDEFDDQLSGMLERFAVDNDEEFRIAEEEYGKSLDNDIIFSTKSFEFKNARKNLEQQLRSASIAFLRDKAEERNTYILNLISELKESKKKVKQFEHEQCSSIRKNAFKLLSDELETAISKAYAYKQYLYYYIYNIEDIFDSSKGTEAIFSYLLPEQYPYKGAILNIALTELDEDGWGCFYFNNEIVVRYYISDIDNYAETISDIPVPVYVDDSSRDGYVLSLQKGRYYLCKRSGGFKGIVAKVTGYDTVNKNVILSYGSSMELYIKPENLENIRHYPPIASEITVFPMYEHYNKKKECLEFFVSQKEEDTEIALNFKEIPVVIADDRLEYFIDYINKNCVRLEYSDSKIAPVDETRTDQKCFKIQFEDNFIIQARIEVYEDNSLFFMFECFLDADSVIAPEDIFVPFTAVLKFHSLEEYYNDSSEELRDNMNNLVVTVSKEFRLQQMLKYAKTGSNYFAAWENVTAKLKEYLTAGAGIECGIKSVPYYKNEKNTNNIIINYLIADEDIERLKAYYQKQMKDSRYSNYGCTFFMEYNGHRFISSISIQCESVKVVVSDQLIDEEQLLSMISLGRIMLFKRESCVPEIRQLMALYNYKIGHMPNQELHYYTMNSSLIEPNTIDIDYIELKNPALKNDESQYSALMSALKEKNIFLIQGPPGTGKTTVIRELIYQTLIRDNNSKVLIVSQANIAVDNVIKGLIKLGISSDDIIRFGRTDKIIPGIKAMSFENKYKKYLEDLTFMAHNNEDPIKAELAQKWLDTLNDSVKKDSDIGELLIRTHRIIGATCVGLAQRNIGLEDLTFDMVIIDECGKALAPEILIPLIKAKKVIMIGDHKQLPPIVNPVLYDNEKIELDDRHFCEDELFEKSFFERLYTNCPDSNKTMLMTQYRMPSIIGSLISDLFYDGMIKNGVPAEKDQQAVYYSSPINIIDMNNIDSYIENDTDGSPYNLYEAGYVAELVKNIRKKDFDASIAVITPYKGQKFKIINAFMRQGLDIHNDSIAVDTVDAFQGDEADVVIYCTTRSKKRTSFFSDYRRINVAVSRTRRELIIIADIAYLKKYEKNSPIRRLTERILKLKDLNCVHAPEAFHIDLSYRNIDTYNEIDIHFVICNDEPNDKDVEREIDFFYEHGFFSKYPIVIKNGGEYSLISGAEIFIAAETLGFDTLTVRIHNGNDTAVINKTFGVPTVSYT